MQIKYKYTRHFISHINKGNVYATHHASWFSRSLSSEREPIVFAGRKETETVPVCRKSRVYPGIIAGLLFKTNNI